MKQTILDTSFMLTCVRQKIDFFEELGNKGFELLIPVQVVREIKGLAESGKKLHIRENAKLTLRILEKRKDNFKKTDIKNKNVDKGILQFAKKNPGVVVATLDREIKQKTKNPKLVIRGKKKLEIV